MTSSFVRFCPHTTVFGGNKASTHSFFSRIWRRPHTIAIHRDWFFRDEYFSSCGPGTATRVDAQYVNYRQWRDQYRHFRRHYPGTYAPFAKKRESNIGRKGCDRSRKHCSHHCKRGHSTVECCALKRQSFGGGSAPVSAMALCAGCCAGCCAFAATSGVAPTTSAWIHRHHPPCRPLLQLMASS